MVAFDQIAVSYIEAGSGIRKSFSSSWKALSLLPVFFWKGLALNSESFSIMAVLSSSNEKNWRFLRAAMIQVSITRTVPSAFGLSLGLTGRAGMTALP